MPTRGSKTSTVPVVWANFGIFRRDPNDFLSWLVTKDETWLCHHDPETKQQSMEWRHSDSPRPKKNSERKIPLENFSSRFFFGIKTASPSLIIFHRAKLSTRYITHLCWCNWRTFLRKTAAGNSPMWSCSCKTMRRLTGHLQPGGNWLTWASSVLITHHILRIWPHWITTCFLDWKKNWKVAFFVRCGGNCCCGDLVERTTFWIILNGLQKLEKPGLRSVLIFVGFMLHKYLVWSL